LLGSDGHRYIHRCVGDRLAEQAATQEICASRSWVAPQRLYSNFIRGIRALPVRIIS